MRLKSWPAPVCRMCLESWGADARNFLTPQRNMCRISRKRPIRRAGVGVCHPPFSDGNPPSTSPSCTLPFSRCMKNAKRASGERSTVQLTSLIIGLPVQSRESERARRGVSHLLHVTGSGTADDRSAPGEKKKCRAQINGILRGET